MPPRPVGHGAGMSTADEHLLATTEGVDEGSAASTVEDATTGGSGNRSASGAPGPLDAEASPAPPVEMESPQSRAARDAVGTGQQLEVGEG